MPTIFYGGLYGGVFGRAVSRIGTVNPVQSAANRLTANGGGFTTQSEEITMSEQFDKAKADKVSKKLFSDLGTAQETLRKLPKDEWENFDFRNHPELDEYNQLCFSLAQTFLLAEFKKKEREKKLAGEWETPELVIAEKEFAEASKFLLKLHPVTQQAALAILSNNVEESKQAGGAQ